MRYKQFMFSVILFIFSFGAIPVSAAQIPDEDSFITLKKNGGWCWYQDPRAVVSENSLFFGSVAAVDRDGSMAGDIEVTSWSISSGELNHFKLHPRLQPDDHNVPAFLVLPGGRLLASYMTHGRDRLMRWRISNAPLDIESWSEEFTVEAGADLSYSNLFMLQAEGNRIYNFHRGIGWNPNFLVSDDLGKSFRYGGRLLNWPRPEKGQTGYSGLDGGRPYLKYASDGINTIHFVTTEDHPRAFDNSLYHGFIRDDKVFKSNGKELGTLSPDPESGVVVSSLTRIFKGDEDNVAWTVDLELDEDGYPFTVFSVQKNSGKWKTSTGRGGLDHRYYYARWDGENWFVNEMAFAGTRLYAREDDYTGLAALNPQNKNVVYISTNADPLTGQPLISSLDGEQHREIFRGITRDGGETWNWEPVTRNSNTDNIRPIVPNGQSDREIVLWLRGKYSTYTNYDLDVVGIVQ
jgi:BNR repeat-containing family member